VSPTQLRSVAEEAAGEGGRPAGDLEKRHSLVRWSSGVDGTREETPSRMSTPKAYSSLALSSVFFVYFYGRLRRSPDPGPKIGRDPHR
jgi:hypothetical protein